MPQHVLLLSPMQHSSVLLGSSAGEQMAGQHESMLRSIPTIAATNLNAHFDAIEARLNIYENMSEAPTLIELVIQNDDIVQRVLSFF
jgi:hypothetical protein